MALISSLASVKEYGKYHAGGVGPSRLAIAICCALTFGWFGLSSFWRARRKSPAPLSPIVFAPIVILSGVLCREGPMQFQEVA